MSWMRCMTSSVSLGRTAIAFMFSVICSTRVAPVMTVLTRGFLAHQASANYSTTRQKQAGVQLKHAGA